MRCKCAVVCHASPLAMRTAAVRCVLPLVVRLLLKICIITSLIRHHSFISHCALHIISFSEINDLCSAVVVCMIASYILSHISLRGLHVISFSETNDPRGAGVVGAGGCRLLCESVGASRSAGHCESVCGRDIASPPHVSGTGRFEYAGASRGMCYCFAGVVRVRVRTRRALGLDRAENLRKRVKIR